MKKFLYIVVPCLAFVLVVAQIVITNELAGVRNDIASLDGDIAALTDEYNLLSQHAASASALATISQKAGLAGFVAPTKSNILVLDEASDVAIVLPGNPSVQ